MVLFVLAIAAYMTLKGLFAVWRTVGLDPWRFDVSPLGARTSDLPAIASAVGLGAARAWLPFVVAALLALYVFKDREFRTTPELVIGGLVVGLVIVGGWYISGHLGYLAEDPNTLEEKFIATNSGRAESYSFTSPVAYTLELLMFWSDTSRIVTFGIAGVLGMLAGSFAYAITSKTFRWEGFGSVEDVANHIIGGVLMGFGGVTALGCTIGQGLTGISTLAIGSILAFGRDHRGLRGGSALPGVAIGKDRMIVFDLVCAHGHRFEGWFASSDAFDEQQGRKLVRCPVCDHEHVERLPSARVNARAGQGHEEKGAEGRKPSPDCPPTCSPSCAKW